MPDASFDYCHPPLISIEQFRFLMKYSTQRILTTHVGSLPRPKKVAELIFAKEREEEYDQTEFDVTIAGAVKDSVARQVEVGVDIVSDGEMSKISYATYIKERISGFEGDTPRSPPKDLLDYPSFLEKQAESGGTPSYKRPKCTGEVRPTCITAMKAAQADYWS